MFNPAYFRYRRVLSQQGGPISRLEEVSHELCDQPMLSAMAYLNAEALSIQNQTNGLPDGVGTDHHPATARFKAVSEAIERWAFHAVNNTAKEKGQYGFDTDTSSSGMAAYPGSAKRARKIALLEALERFCLLAWWEGQLGSEHIATPIPNLRAIRLKQSYTKAEIVVTWENIDKDYYVYGFSYGKTTNYAVMRAYLEQRRVQSILEEICKKQGLRKLASWQDADHPYEKRIRYYASPDGSAEFFKRVEMEPTAQAPELKVLFDGEIPGPWSQYARVWRIVYGPPTREHLTNRHDYFYW